MIFNRLAIITALVAAVSTTTTSAVAADAGENTAEKTKVNISIQPAFHGIPIYAALQFGWFDELGLDVELSLYASGGPQVKDAVENKAWDFGIAGSVPNVLAGAQGIKTIGINNDESATTEVFGAPGVTAWPPPVVDLYDGIFTATADSTGELLLRKCLDAAGINFDDDHVIEMTQGEILTALGKHDVVEGSVKPVETLPSYGSLWAPNTYTYEGNNPHDVEVMCSGRDVDFKILGGLMVREEYATENADIVTKILAAYLRGVSFMQNKNVEESVLDISNAFHDFAGIPVSNPVALEEDLILRPLFNLDQQLDAMNRNFANNYESELDKHYLELEDFLFSHNVIETKYLPKEYVTDEYMKMVSDDADLRAFSYFGSLAEEGGLNLASSSVDDGEANGVLIAGIVLCTIGILSMIVAIVMCCTTNKQSQIENEQVSQKDASSNQQQQQQQQEGGSSTSWRNEAV